MRTSSLKIAAFLCVFAVPGWAQMVVKTMKNLPGTAQTNSYTNTFGEDSDYNIHPPGYLISGSGMVTDTVTGLQWQRTDGGEMTVENALVYCDTLTLGGYSDWRLPNCHELFSLFHHDKPNPALNSTFFTATGAEYWWSSERQANDPNKIWVTNAGGGVGNHLKTETISAGGTKKYHVRAVRDVTPAPVLAAHFVNNGDGTSTDLLTGLMWRQVSLPDTLSWEQALMAAENLTENGYTDWRLPDIKELQSINDESIVNPSVSPVFFSGAGIGRFWSSTSLPNQSSKAWYLDTRFGITTYLPKTSRLYVLCVRGGTATSGVSEYINRRPGFEILPNPSSGKTLLRCEKQMDQVQVFDMSGLEMYQERVQENSLLLPAFKPGFYVVRVRAGKESWSRILEVQ